MARRTVITGIGWVTPLGDNIEEVWSRLQQCESGVEPTSIFDARTFPTQFAAEVKDYDLKRYLGATADQHADAARYTRFALGAAKLAWENSRLGDAADLERDRIGVYLGGGEGPIDFGRLSLRRNDHHDHRQIHSAI